jgi:hypothetical protein
MAPGWVGGTVLAVLCAGPAWADTASVPYAKLVSVQALFTTVPAAQRDKLILAVAIVHADKANHAPIGMWVDANGTRTNIPVTEDGVVSLPARPDWASAGVAVQTDQPKGTLHVGVYMMIRPPASQAISVGYLLAAAQQADDAMRAGARQMGGYVASLMAPSVHQIGVKLATCCGGMVTVHGAAGDAVLKQDATGLVAVPRDVLWARDAGSLVATAPIVSLDPFPNER